MQTCRVCSGYGRSTVGLLPRRRVKLPSRRGATYGAGPRRWRRLRPQGPQPRQVWRDVAGRHPARTGFPGPAPMTPGGMGLVGVDISGGEYGSAGGTLGTDYVYPSQAEIDYYASEGMTVVRMPFLLERLEPAPGGPLDPSQVADLQQVISWAQADGMDVILDPHNYGDAWGAPIGAAAGGTPDAAFENFRS